MYSIPGNQFRAGIPVKELCRKQLKLNTSAMQQMCGVQPGKATADNSHLCLGNDGHVYPLKEAWAECLHDVAAHL